jgi:hypothetical protein
VKLRILAEAEAELLEATRYYEDRQIGLGADFYRRVAECMEQIARDPLRFPIYEGLRSNRVFRRALLERFPYVVIYKVLPGRSASSRRRAH